MNDQLIDALEWRYATKKYDSSFQLDPKDKATLEQVLQLTPSSYGLQPLHYIWLEDQKLLEQTKNLAWNQEQITAAAAVLVLCTLTTLDSTYLDAHIDLTRDTRSMQEEQIQGFRAHLHTAIATKPDHEILLWNDKQAT